MIVLKIGMFQTLALAVIAIYSGKIIAGQFPILKKYCIPAPVIGGSLFAILTTLFHSLNFFSLQFDYKTLNTFFYNLFFAAMGFAASTALLKQGGKLVLIFSILAALLAVLQNILALSVGVSLGMEPLVALMSGSIPLTGGHGNAAAFAPIAEQMGAVGAIEVAVAAATFGLVAGCIMGGPLGRGLINKYQLANSTPTALEQQSTKKHSLPSLSYKQTSEAIFLLLIACGIGQTLFLFIKTVFPDINIPLHVMSMLGGLLLRLVLDRRSKNHYALYENIAIIGEVSLAIFVSVVIITMQLWKLADLAFPLLTILLLQVLLCYLFCIFITFRLCGKNYDAAIIATGHSGFGLGAVPVSMTTMTEVCTRYHPSQIAFFVVPLIGGFISNISNALIITFFFNIAS